MFTSPPPVAIRVKHEELVQRFRFGRPANLVLLERLASIALGFGLLTALGRRLFIVGGVAFMGIYLIYRGLVGYCPAYAGVRRWQGSALRPANGGYATGDPCAGMEEDLHRELRRERQRDKIDERSWESFPASDPPA